VLELATGQQPDRAYQQAIWRAAELRRRRPDAGTLIAYPRALGRRVPPPRRAGAGRRDLHVDAVADDLAVLDDDLLVPDPGALDVLERLGRALDALVDGIVGALERLRRDLGDSCDAHGAPPEESATP